jgi:hypothetical protein
MALAAGAGRAGRTLLAECRSALLDFFFTDEACVLRLVCREFKDAVAAHPWYDRCTLIAGSIAKWRSCFPLARCANVREDETVFGSEHRLTPVVDADFVHFEGLWELEISWCMAVTDAAFVHLRDIRILAMVGCSQLAITDAGLAHMAGIEELWMDDCSQCTLTDAAYAPLRGLCLLSVGSADQYTDGLFVHLKDIHILYLEHCHTEAFTDAALRHLLGIKMLYYTSSTCFSDKALTDSGIKITNFENFD